MQTTNPDGPVPAAERLYNKVHCGHLSTLQLLWTHSSKVLVTVQVWTHSHSSAIPAGLPHPQNSDLVSLQVMQWMPGVLFSSFCELRLFMGPEGQV